MAYLYRHIRLDTNIPFYIGIGSDNNGRYTRAHTRQCRNRHWHNIVNKAGYEVEIVIDNISYEESIKKEMEFIKLYGRKEFGGLLVNLTDGGEGNVGYITSDEVKKKQSLKKIGKPSHRKGCKQYPHVIEAVRKAHIGKTTWNKGLPMSVEWRNKWKIANKGKPSPMKGKRHSEATKEKCRVSSTGRPAWNKGKKGEYTMPPSKLKKVVMKYDMNGVFIQEYASVTEAAMQNNCKKGGISKACLGDTKFHGAYKWKYKIEAQ